MPQRKATAQEASVALTGADGRLHAPSAERNSEAILALLRHHGPAEGRALELASGTGQHAVAFSTALPGLLWQPTEVDEARLSSVAAWTRDIASIATPARLDATAPGWGADWQGQDLILLVNLLHLISATEARTLIREAAAALAPGGRFILYGPFLRDGETTSEGDAAFHAAITAADPETGYKDDFDVIDWLHDAGLELVDVVEMPANNLAFVIKRAT